MCKRGKSLALWISNRTIPTISFAPWNLKSDPSFVEDTFVFSFPLTMDGDPDPELQFLTNLGLVGAEDTGTPWASIAGEARAGEAGAVERPGNILPPNFILGMKRVEGTEKPAEAFGVGSTAVGVGVGRFPGVGVPGELEAAWITSWGGFAGICTSRVGLEEKGLSSWVSVNSPSSSELPASEDRPPSSSYAWYLWERTVPTPSVWQGAGHLDMGKDEQIRKPTGGAETKDGREHLMSSVNISSNSSKLWASEVGTNPNLIWTLPVEGVPTRAETRERVIGCKTDMKWRNRKIKI